MYASSKSIDFFVKSLIIASYSFFYFMLESELIAFGLTLREATVYMVMLSLGEAPASVIAKRSGLQRLTTYSTLDHLLKMNLITFYEKRSKRFYRACSPHSFLKYCDDQIISIQSKRARLEQILPKLSSCLRRGEGSSIDVGKLSLIRDRILFQNRCVSSLKGVPEWMFFHDGSLWSLVVAIQQRVSLSPKCILPFSEKKKLSKYVRSIQAHYIPDAHLSGPINVMIFGKTTMFILEDGIEFSAIEIDCQEIACRLGTLFSFLWRMNFFEHL